MTVKGKAEWLLSALNYERMASHPGVAGADVTSAQQLLVVLGKRGKVRTISRIVSKALSVMEPFLGRPLLLEEAVQLLLTLVVRRSTYSTTLALQPN